MHCVAKESGRLENEEELKMQTSAKINDSNQTEQNNANIQGKEYTFVLQGTLG
jgi:hypothetical protein